MTIRDDERIALVAARDHFNKVRHRGHVKLRLIEDGPHKWREDLAMAWATGRDSSLPHSGTLRLIRNTRGPSWLLDSLDDADLT